MKLINNGNRKDKESDLLSMPRTYAAIWKEYEGLPGVTQEEIETVKRRERNRRDSQKETLAKVFAKIDVDFNPLKFKILKVIPLLHWGWECDSIAWIVQHGDKKYVFGTNHGTLYAMPKREFKEKLLEYSEASKGARQALRALGGKL